MTRHIPMTTRRLAALALGVAAFAMPAAAQRVPIVQAGADGRFETEFDAKTSVEGFTPAQVRALHGNLRAINERLRAMPAVSAPPAPVCHRQRSWVELISRYGVLAAEGGVFTPINFNGGRCSPMTTGGLEWYVNAPHQLTPDSGVHLTDAEGKGDWFVLEIKEIAPTMIRFTSNKYALTHGRAPLFRTVTAGRYIDEMVRRADAPSIASVWRGLKTKITPTQAAAPACMPGPSDRDMLSLAASCPLNRQVWELNHAYFDRSRPSDIQLLIFQTSPLSARSENADQLASRIAMWKELDIGSFASLVR